MDGPSRQPAAVTRSRIAADLRALGVRAGGVTMVHTRMSAIGRVAGAAESVVRALLDALGPEGTLMAYASWEDHAYHPGEWAPELRDGFLAEPPVFDVLVSEAVRDHGRIPERVRTWPGAVRSAHPEASVVAIGARARWLTSDHPERDSYGPGSPFARLVEADGQVLMLGAPLETVTLLHHAEAIARVARKRRVTYRVTVAEDGRAVERTLTDIDTATGALPYERLNLPEDPFAAIARAALDAGIGVRGRVGAADSHLFPAPALTAFATAWMEERFGAGAEAPDGRPPEAVEIRPYTPADADALAEVYRRSVLGLAPRDYTPRQVAAWMVLAPTPERLRERYGDGRIVLMAVAADGRALAFGDVAHDGHIDLLFCVPEAAGTGVASALYDAMEAAARAGGRTRLHVEASEAARRLLTRKGFREVRRRDFVIEGVGIHNYAMEKDLSAPEA